MQKRQNLPIVCGTLVVINVIVYLICTFTGDLLYNIGELDAVAVLRYGAVSYTHLTLPTT